MNEFFFCAFKDVGMRKKIKKSLGGGAESNSRSYELTLSDVVSLRESCVVSSLLFHQLLASACRRVVGRHSSCGFQLFCDHRKDFFQRWESAK